MRIIQPVRNDTSNEMQLVIEPCGESFLLPPGKRLYIEMEGFADGDHAEWYFSTEIITVVPFGKKVRIKDGTTILQTITL
jgi:hypothetical protein